MNLYDGFNPAAVHIAEMVEDKHINQCQIVKCYIPTLMPKVSKGKPKSIANKITKSNIKNKNKAELPISASISTANYVDIKIPEYIRTTLEHATDVNARDRYIVHSGKLFLIVFLGGDINDIKVIGRG